MRSAAPLMMHSGHRNPEVPGHYTREMAITDTAVHDIDTARWLLGEEIVAAQVLKPRKNSLGGDLEDPLLTVLETESGVLIQIETNVNIRYGYDIRGEIVGEQGTVTPRRVHAGHRAGPAGRSPAGSPRTGGSGSSAPTTSNSRNGSTPSPAVASSAPAPGTGTRPRRCPMQPSRPCTTAPRVDVTLVDKPALYCRQRHRLDTPAIQTTTINEEIMATIRLTVAQAVVRFLAHQYSERDGVQQRLIPGCFGIFGHGNVAGVGQALLQAATTG